MHAPVKRFVDDPSKTWEERFRALEAHHEKETAWLYAQLEGRVHLEIDIDGYVDERGIQYLGKAVRQEDGTWQCLANVGGALCRVEVKITPKERS